MLSPKEQKGNSGFTLIELLIVVVIISTLATVVSSGFSNVKLNASESSIERNLVLIQAALDRYAAEHGSYPNREQWRDTCIGIGARHRVGSGYTFLRNRLTLYSNREGQVCDSRQGGLYPLGPYLSGDFPINPSRESRSVLVLPDESDSGNATTYGWIYDAESGSFTAAP